MIECKLGGRMGNQLFQYSVCRIIAEKNGYNFYVPRLGDPSICASTEGHHLLNFFPDLNLGINDGCIKYKFSEDHTSQKYDPNILDLPDFTLISGFFQTDKYYEGYENRVRSWFKIKGDQITDSILDKYDVNEYCFIHLRGSDYKNHTHWFLDRNYYQLAMNKILEKYNIKFLIITDDILTAKEWFPDIDAISNEMMVDFKLIYYSKYCIISNSTFSWWPAWLSDKKIIIAPDNWLNHNRPEMGFYPVDMRTNRFIYI